MSCLPSTASRRSPDFKSYPNLKNMFLLNPLNERKLKSAREGNWIQGSVLLCAVIIAFFYKVSAVILLSLPGWMSGLKLVNFLTLLQPLVSIHLLQPQLGFLSPPLRDQGERKKKEIYLFYHEFFCTKNGSRKEIIFLLLLIIYSNERQTRTALSLQQKWMQTFPRYITRINSFKSFNSVSCRPVDTTAAEIIN